jgi:hypothetical protein
MGPGYSKYVTGHVIDQEGRIRSNQPQGRPLEVGASRVLELRVPRIAWDPPRPIRLVVEWRDEDGQIREEISNLLVQHEMHPDLQ